MTEHTLALLRGVGVFMALIGVGGICFDATTPLTLSCLGLSIVIFTLTKRRSNNE